jgi:hypothetical protein
MNDLVAFDVAIDAAVRWRGRKGIRPERIRVTTVEPSRWRGGKGKRQKAKVKSQK